MEDHLANCPDGQPKPEILLEDPWDEYEKLQNKADQNNKVSVMGENKHLKEIEEFSA